MNNEQQVTTSATPTVIIEQAQRNLSVSGREASHVSVRSRSERYSVEQGDNEVTIRLEDDSKVFVPTGSTLIVRSIHGNAHIDGIEGEVTIEHVHGNLAVHTIGRLAIESVSGNVTAQQIGGDVTAERISGNATFRQIDGSVSVEACEGNLTVRRAAGDVQSSVSGNATLYLSPQPGHTIAVNTLGNINCYIPPTTQSQVSLKAKGQVKVRHLPLPESGSKNSFTLGEGTGQIQLEAWGNVTLVGVTPGEMNEEGEFTFDYDYDFDFDFSQAEEMMRQFSEQMETHARELARQFEARLANLGSGDEIASKVQEKVQRALRQAEEKIARAARQAEEKASRHAERAAARAGRYGFSARGPMPRHPMSPGAVVTPPTPPMPPRPGSSPSAQGPARPASAPVSDEERMRILRMLEEGKITVDQAETLLAALEG